MKDEEEKVKKSCQDSARLGNYMKNGASQGTIIWKEECDDFK